MKLSKINIRNFRKLKNCTLDFGEKQTILVGANNSGKTSCLQAIVSFLKDSNHFSTQDFTLPNWQYINVVAKGWVEKDELTPSLNDIVGYLPQIDVWIEVGKGEEYLVKDLIPSLEWKGKTVGVRIIYAPKDIEKLYANFKTAYLNAQKLKDEKMSIAIYPKNLWDYLNRGKLNTEFTLRYYILDIDKEKISDMQEMPSVEFTDGNPLKKIIKVDLVDAHRPFSDPDAKDHSSQNTLSKQLQEYYELHIKPKDNQIGIDDVDLLEALQTANKNLDANIGKAFEGRINELKKINYPGIHNPSIEVHSFVDVKNSINHESAVQFALDDSRSNDLKLPESYNGLGFQNLISMYFRLIQFRDEWLHEGKMVKSDDDSNYIEPIHLVFVEEPEAHLHAQAQQVFVDRAYKTLCESPKLEANHDNYTTQLVLTTHSNHIVHNVDLNNMRYFHRESTDETSIPISKIINLTNVFGTDEQTKRFVTRYIRLSQCDIYFADAAILVEGSGERILMPKFLQNEKLSNKFISIIEVNGSHAHKFKKLIEKLEIPCLVITDIDAQTPGTDGTLCTQRGAGQITSNNTIKQWIPKKEKIDDLLDLDENEKISHNVRIAYQTGITVKLKEGVEGEVYPYTFEDAVALDNIDLFKQDNLDKMGLVTTFRNIIKKNNTVKDCCEKMKNTLTSGKKAPFAIYLLYETQFEKLKTPSYIKEGLVWLKNKLNKK